LFRQEEQASTGGSVEAEAELELGVVGVVAPERLGDVVGPGALRVGLDRGAAGGEEDRAEPASIIGPTTAVAAATAPRTLNSSGPRRSSTPVSRIGFMNSFAGRGEYSSTSTGPSRSASDPIVVPSASESRMSTAPNSAVIPSLTFLTPS
jgi:hypothetical protein